MTWTCARCLRETPIDHCDRGPCPMVMSKKLDPWILWHHVDGPVLVDENGQLHWLTLWERIKCRLGVESARSLSDRIVKGA